jgi:hypothetical protein
MRATYIVRHIWFTQNPIDSGLITSKKYLSRVIKTGCLTKYLVGYADLTQLTHKINYHLPYPSVHILPKEICF